MDTIEIRLLYFTIDSITVRVIPDKQKVTAIPRIGSLYRVPPPKSLGTIETET